MNKHASEMTPRWRARRLLRDWRAWIVVVGALYTLLGFVIVPLVAKNQIPKQTPQTPAV